MRADAVGEPLENQPCDFVIDLVDDAEDAIVRGYYARIFDPEADAQESAMRAGR